MQRGKFHHYVLALRSLVEEGIDIFMLPDKQHLQPCRASIDVPTAFIAEPGPVQSTLNPLQTFDIERSITPFYAHFQREHTLFQNSIVGIASSRDRAQYGLMMLSRLMFVYFLQKKGLLANNINYLADTLQMIQANYGQGRFLSFYRHLLQRLFHHPLHQPVSDLAIFLKDVRYLNGGLLEVHNLERMNRNIQIPDEAFERLFAFFDTYQWQIAGQPLLHEDEIDPDIIGYIFEKYVNHKPMGVYYTKKDITNYIGKNTIIPYLLQATAQKCSEAFGADSIVWHLLRRYPERYINESLRNREYLPAESAREYQQRQMRYQTLKGRLEAGEINSVPDLITCNLDLCQYAQDVIRTCKSSTLLHAFYQNMSTMSVLDPTCGSGAFLFAALDILAPLYETCFARMKTMLVDADTVMCSDDLSLFQVIIDQSAKKTNRSYFILKCIIANNLYGVDIMGEVVEICKLRLFLKLIAQLQNGVEEESLSTIDLNIRAGNALVGFARYGDVKVSIRETIGAEQNTRIRLREKLDRYLASQYGIDPHTVLPKSKYERAFKAWRASHHPFHWFIDFRSVMERGGFAVIIGNPPYVEYSKVRREYKVQGYETESCGNLYAAVTERSLALCRAGESYLGLIVPLSLCGGERFAQLRRTITRQTTTLWLANFEIFPSRLFEGAFQRLSLLLAHCGTTEKHVTYVTRIQRWYALERPHLINLITYTQAQRMIKADVFPRLASALQETILHKLAQKANGGTIATRLQASKTEHFVYYQEATNYWMKATCWVPYYKRNGVLMEPAHGRFLYFEDEVTAHTIMALMNSSLFYVWFATFSDGFHLSHALVKEFPLGEDLYAVEELTSLLPRLQDAIRAHARISTRNTKVDVVQKKEGHRIELEEYRMGASKALLDEIDAVLAQYYGLTEDELHFILNYDGKYRMGKENRK